MPIFTKQELKEYLKSFTDVERLIIKYITYECTDKIKTIRNVYSRSLKFLDEDYVIYIDSDGSLQMYDLSNKQLMGKACHFVHNSKTIYSFSWNNRIKYSISFPTSLLDTRNDTQKETTSTFQKKHYLVTFSKVGFEIEIHAKFLAWIIVKSDNYRVRLVEEFETEKNNYFLTFDNSQRECPCLYLKTMDNKYTKIRYMLVENDEKKGEELYKKVSAITKDEFDKQYKKVYKLNRDRDNQPKIHYKCGNVWERPRKYISNFYWSPSKQRFVATKFNDKAVFFDIKYKLLSRYVKRLKRFYE